MGRGGLQSRRKTFRAQDARHGSDHAETPITPIAGYGRDVAVEVAVRSMAMDDAAYVLDSWCSSFRRSPQMGPIDERVFKVEHRARIYRLIPRTKVLIACSKTDHSNIRGWICFEPPREMSGLAILHYVVVRPEAQCRGIATQLVALAKKTQSDPSGPLWATSWTIPMRQVGPKWQLLFNPYLLDYPSEPVRGGSAFGAALEAVRCS